MTAIWTRETVLALAPDSSSAKAGTGLATLRKWLTLGQNEEALWGECQGSGSTPYQTQIDLSEPAFRCSCPSRKFPCKHAIGLLLLYAEQAASFQQKQPPEWVAKWLESRAQRSERKAQKAQASEPKDLEAQAKRNAQRQKRVEAGLKELETWLHDLVRNGISSVQAEGYAFWDKPAARLIDAQAGALARRLREMPARIFGKEQWADDLLEELSKIHLIIEGFKRIDALPEPLQHDLRVAIGWPQREEDLAAAEPVSGIWTVVGQTEEQAEPMKSRRTWLYEQASQRYALLLEFVPRFQAFDLALVPAATFEATLRYFPSNYPLRAALQNKKELSTSPAPSGYQSIDELLDSYSRALSQKPWLNEFPMLLDRACISMLPNDNKRFVLRDQHDQGLPIAPDFERYLEYLAYIGGQPATIFGEWDGYVFRPLSMWGEAGYSFFGVEV
jgi:Uncharacterized conserved protein